jgi:hypothetical protein
MKFNFHKRAAMVVLRKDLARQKLVGTAVRDCFPSSVMETVRDYAKTGLELKTAGRIAK